MVFYHGWLGGRKRFLCKVRHRKLLAFFPSVLQHAFSSTANITVILPTES